MQRAGKEFKNKSTENKKRERRKARPGEMNKGKDSHRQIETTIRKEKNNKGMKDKQRSNDGLMSGR